MAPAHEIAAQVLIVVDLPVEHDHLGAVFIEDRLPAAAQVDDAETPHPEPHGTLHPHAFVVRAAMPQGGAHPAHQRLRHGTFPLAVHDARNAAHVAWLQRSCWTGTVYSPPAEQEQEWRHSPSGAHCENCMPELLPWRNTRHGVPLAKTLTRWVCVAGE